MAENAQTKLEDLYVDEEVMNEKLLTSTLAPYIRIGKQSGDLVLQSSFDDLTTKQKIVVVLLAQKGRCGLEVAENEWLTPTEIANVSGIKKGTVYPTIRELENDERLADSEDGQYRIPTHNLETAREFIEGSAPDE